MPVTKSTIAFEDLVGKAGRMTIKLQAAGDHRACRIVIGDDVATLADERENLIQKITMRLVNGDKQLHLDFDRDRMGWSVWQRGSDAAMVKSNETTDMVLQPGFWRVADIHVNRSNPLARVNRQEGAGRGRVSGERMHPPGQGH